VPVHPTAGAGEPSGTSAAKSNAMNLLPAYFAATTMISIS
jgi:hypothetical protein